MCGTLPPPTCPGTTGNFFCIFLHSHLRPCNPAQGHEADLVPDFFHHMFLTWGSFIEGIHRDDCAPDSAVRCTDGPSNSGG